MCGAELQSLPEGVQRVAKALQDSGHPHSPMMLDDAARTAQQAADALGITECFIGYQPDRRVVLAPDRNSVGRTRFRRSSDAEPSHHDEIAFDDRRLGGAFLEPGRDPARQLVVIERLLHEDSVRYADHTLGAAFSLEEERSGGEGNDEDW